MATPSTALAAPFTLADPDLNVLWRQWQPLDARGQARPLASFDPAGKPFSSGDGKAQDKARVEAIAADLDALQNLFYADRRRKLLLVLQGPDTAGKDGAIRGVFSRMSPLGVRVVSWKSPSTLELAHDYLWRIHKQAPAAGEIVIFNRSHYEDVLVPVAQASLDENALLQRYAQINDFERMLSENGTVIVKFMLHISADEQRERLQQRLDDPTKHWKFDQADITARRQWPQYQAAYERLLAATHTDWAPWTVVPANSKTHRNLMIGTLLQAILNNLDLRYPPGDPALEKIRIT